MTGRLGIRLHGGLSARRSVELARSAEANGFASVWFAENPMERGVLPALAACAAATRRIELGVGVWNPFLRHPAQIAMDIAALDELSEGRTTLGIGSGLAAPIKRLGIDNTRTLDALRDTVAIVRGLLAGGSVTYKGRSFSVEDAKLGFAPRRPDMPLLMAARGPKALALAGEIADGLMISNMCPPGFAAYAASIARPGRLVQYAPCIVAADRATAYAAIKPVLAGMLKTFWALGQKVPAAKVSLVAYSGIPEADFAAAVAGPPAALDDRFVQAFAVAGSPEDCARAIAGYAVTDLVLTFVGPDPLAEMAMLARFSLAQTS
ncbi:MAG TPA: LLM class flavin-dependent oxidoreductase [Reyranella sp.]|nr:LLM class flavin-dependent oxidoreductase [Reyranella sp.]